MIETQNINEDSLMKIKEYKHYIELKRKTHRYLDTIYKKGYSPRNVIGSCSFLYKELKPTSYDDFLKKYTEYTDNPNPTLRGRTLKELIELSKSFQEESEKAFYGNDNFPKLTFEDYYDLLVLHIIIETYDGQKVEEYYRNMYENAGYKTVLPNERDDAKLGIDFIIKTDEGDHFIQVKPRSFITSISSGTRADRENHFIKEKMIKEQYNEKSRLEFIFYERDENNGDVLTYINGKTGKMRFKLSDVCENNGFTKYTSKNNFQTAFNLKKM